MSCTKGENIKTKKLHIYLAFILFSLVVTTSQSFAQPHTHGGRSHSHGLPSQGFGHRHNNGMTGKAASNTTNHSKSAPLKKSQLRQGFGTSSYQNGNYYAGNYLNGQRSGQGTLPGGCKAQSD